MHVLHETPHLRFQSVNLSNHVLIYVNVDSFPGSLKNKWDGNNSGGKPNNNIKTCRYHGLEALNCGRSRRQFINLSSEGKTATCTIPSHLSLKQSYLSWGRQRTAVMHQITFFPLSLSGRGSLTDVPPMIVFIVLCIFWEVMSNICRKVVQ